MWTRRALKQRGKRAFFRNFWAVVAICFLLAFIGAEYTDSVELIHRNEDARSNADLIQEQTVEALEKRSDVIGVQVFTTSGSASWVQRWLGPTVVNALSSQFGWLFRILSGGLFILAAVVMLCFSFVVVNPVMVGARHFLLHNRLGKAPPLELGALFHRHAYFRIAAAMFFRWLFTTLWTLLLIIPGIIKTFEYKMIPYILADNPHLDRRRVFALSREMMRGEKWNVFVLQLSFFLWNCLSALTLGIAGIFFVNPYIACTEAELYAALKQKVLSRGFTTSEELPMELEEADHD